MFDKLRDVAGKATSLAGDLQGMAVEKLRETVQEINEALPLLGGVGYGVGPIAVELGISPKVVISLIKQADVSVEAFDGLMKAHASRKMLCTIVGALRQASLLQGKIQFRNHCFKTIDIELGIPPAVRMVFLQAEVAAALAAAAPAVADPDPVPLPAVAEQPTGEYEPAVDLFPPPPGPPAGPEPEAPAPLPEPPAALPDGPPVFEPREILLEALRTGEVPAVSEPPAPVEAPEETLRFRCPACGVRYRVDPRRAGEVLSCRRCGVEITIPGASTVGPPEKQRDKRPDQDGGRSGPS